MPPGPEAALLRWSDEEHDLLVQMTNDQIELEEEDESMMISWTKHWKQVSSRLQEHGYSRTPNACRGYWKRGMESQKATEQAAGPRWDDSEHQILMGMTEDQLELEKVDSSSIIPWPRHWKRVSHQLEENGYTRSPEACAAYWTLVQNNSAHAAAPASGTDTDGQSWEAHGGINDEDYLLVALGDTSTQQSTKVQLWTDEEHENLLRILKARRELEEDNEVEKLSGLQLWTFVSQLHQQSGFDRTWEACKTYWQNAGRSRSGFDERPKPSSKIGTEGRLFESKPSSVSSMWSPVNELEDSIMALESTFADNPTPRNFQKDRLQQGAEALQNQMSLPDQNLLLTTSMNGLVSDSESSGYDSSRVQGEHDNDIKPQTLTQPINLSELKSSDQPRERAFRFKAHQRAFLEADIAKNGSCPDIERREELAAKLGVEEKTIRNWFNHYRQKCRKTQESPAIKRASIPTSNNLDNSSSNKRPLEHADTEQTEASVNGSSMHLPTEDGTPSHLQPFKKLRLGDILGQGTHEKMDPFASLNRESLPCGSAEVLRNGLPISQDGALLTGREEGCGGHSYGSTTSQMDRLSGASSSPSSQVSAGSGFNSILKKHREIRSSLAEQPTSILQPTRTMGPWHVNAGMTSNRSETTTLAASSSKPIGEDGGSQISSRMNTQSGENGSATQAATIPSAQSTSTTTEEQKAWASRQVQNFQSEILKLNCDTITRAARIKSIEKEIEDFKKEHDKNSQDKEEEIARVLTEIEERYNKKRDILNTKLETHSQSKQSEQDGLKRNELEVSRKETGKKCFQAIVDYYEIEGDGH